MMLWKRLYGDNVWAHCNEELEGDYLFSLKYGSSIFYLGSDTSLSVIYERKI